MSYNARCITFVEKLNYHQLNVNEILLFLKARKLACNCKDFKFNTLWHGDCSKLRWQNSIFTMRFYKFIFLLFLFVSSNSIVGQESSTAPERSPEQEALKQTEKMQTELQLSPEQTRQIHEINLKYALARKVSNTRSDAIQRIKDKEVELSRILNSNQQYILQNKRYERSTFQSSMPRQQVQSQSARPPVDNNASQNQRYASPPVTQQGATRNTQQSNEPERRVSTERQNPTAEQSTTTRSAAPRVYPNESMRSSFRSSQPASGASRSASPSQPSTSQGRR